MTDRILVAAKILARDHGHLLIDSTFAVRLEARVMETLLRTADRFRYDGFHPTRFDDSPLPPHLLPKWRLHRIRSGTKNKRLLALIGLAVETKSAISFTLPESRRGRGLVSVDLTESLNDASDAALGFAETYLRIELESAKQALVSRAGHALRGLAFDPVQGFSAHDLTDDPVQRVGAHLGAVMRFGSWIERTLATEAERTPRDIAERLDLRAARRGISGSVSALLSEAAAEIRRLRG